MAVNSVNVAKISLGDFFNNSFGINLILSIYNIEDYKNYSDYLDSDELFFCNAKKLNDLIYKIIIKKKILIVKFDFI